MEGVDYISGGKCSTGIGSLVRAAETKQVFCPMVLVRTLRGKRNRQPGHQSIKIEIHDLQKALLPVQIGVNFRLPSFVLYSMFYKRVKKKKKKNRIVSSSEREGLSVHRREPRNSAINSLSSHSGY